MDNNFLAQIERFLDTDAIDHGQILATAKYLLSLFLKEQSLLRAGIWTFNSSARTLASATCIVEADSSHIDTYSQIKQVDYPNYFHCLKKNNYSTVIQSFEFSKLGRYLTAEIDDSKTELIIIAPIKVNGQISAYIQCESSNAKAWNETSELLLHQVTSLYGRCVANANKTNEINKLRDKAPTTVNNRHLKAIHEGINQFSLVCTTDKQGIITDINENYLELCGYKREEILGQPQTILKSTAHDEAYYQIMWRLLSQGNIWKGRLCNKKKNGELFWLQGTIAPVFDQSKAISGYISFYHDITQEVETEQQLKHSERLAKLGSFRIDPGQTFWHCSAEFHRFLDVANNSLISQQDFERFIHPEHRTLFRFNFQSLQQDKTQISLNVRTNDVQEKWVHLTARKQGSWIIGSIQDITDIQKKDKTLHKTISLQNAIFDAANFAVVATNTQGYISHFNRTAEELLNYKAEELIGIETPLIFHDRQQLMEQLTVTDQGEPTFKDIIDHSARGCSNEQEWTLISKNGRQIPVELAYSTIKNSYHQITGYLAVIKDISQQKLAEKTSSNLATILATAGDLAHFGGFEYHIEEDNLQLTHVDLQTLLATTNRISLTNAVELVHPNDKSLFTESFEKAINLGMEFDIQIKIKSLNQGYDWVRIAGTAQTNESSPSILGFIHTINAQKKLEQQLSSLALTDELTSINNRRALLQTLSSEWNRHQRYQTPSAVLLIDIDFFKKVNDQWGHDVGDFLLSEFSKSIQQQLRNSDTFGRLGGEEFLIIVSNNTEAEASELAEKLRHFIEHSTFNYQGLGLEQVLPLNITVSIGVAGLDSRIENQDQWLISADNALYRAKLNGRNQVECANLETTIQLTAQKIV